MKFRLFLGGSLESHDDANCLDLAGMMSVRLWNTMHLLLASGDPMQKQAGIRMLTLELHSKLREVFGVYISKQGFPKFCGFSIFSILPILRCICFLFQSVPVSGRPQLLLVQLPAIHIFHCKSFNSIFRRLANPEFKSPSP